MCPRSAPRRRGLCPPFPKLSASLEQGRPHSPCGTSAHSGGPPPARSRHPGLRGRGGMSARSTGGHVPRCPKCGKALGRRGRTYRRGPAPQPKPRRVAPTGRIPRRGAPQCQPSKDPAPW
ncbi:hypothetical protein CP970_22195 [Streptomyces kanamyceticus]|uniref:Uncharacterized protein n=1 Tax=Streptomyces kanamyceticus TaxID=1967 RepID=A0A5J6GFE2_STRKN|nr:hypothetical protein CP970_22195 [Streptomyces kanamyceticus]